MFSDEKRLKQILMNLMSNAFKFIREGYISLNVKLNELNPSLIHFEVEDTGIGIPQKNIPLITEEGKK